MAERSGRQTGDVAVENYLFSYVPDRFEPPLAEMDAHLNKQGSWTVARLMDTLWYIGTDDSSETVTAYATSLLSAEASYLVATCIAIASKNLPERP
jgi:hypothetical protein